jgi:hypothetical protein
MLMVAEASPGSISPPAQQGQPPRLAALNSLDRHELRVSYDHRIILCSQLVISLLPVTYGIDISAKFFCNQAKSRAGITPHGF